MREYREGRDQGYSGGSSSYATPGKRTLAQYQVPLIQRKEDPNVKHKKTGSFLADFDERYSVDRVAEHYQGGHLLQKEETAEQLRQEQTTDNADYEKVSKMRGEEGRRARAAYLAAVVAEEKEFCRGEIEKEGKGQPFNMPVEGINVIYVDAEIGIVADPRQRVIRVGNKLFEQSCGVFRASVRLEMTQVANGRAR